MKITNAEAKKLGIKTKTKGKPRKRDTYPGFPDACVKAGLPRPLTEYQFCVRKWKFDWAWPKQLIALECNGAIWRQGRHSRGSGQLKDFEKFNAAAIHKWRIFYCTPKEVNNGSILDILIMAFAME